MLLLVNFYDYVVKNKESRWSFMKQDCCRSKVAYHFEAAVEYLISILVTGAFLTALLNEIGVSDAISGMISSLTTFACMVQMASLFIKRNGRGLKRWVSLLHLMNQLLFAILYLFPSLKLAQATKALLLVGVYIAGLFISQLVTPYKLAWLMSLVEPNKRGRFTAVKEMISLLLGMVFSLIMGMVVDHFQAAGRIQEAFIICNVVLVILALVHFILLILCDPPETNQAKETSLKENIHYLCNNKRFRRVLLVSCLFQCTQIVIPFYGVYQLNVLGFSLTYVSVITIFQSLTRMAVSLPIGKYADHTSWSKALYLGFLIQGASFFINFFTIPSNGHILFFIYSMLYGASMAAMNSSLMNIVFEYVDPTISAAALGIENAIGGIAGFCASLIGGIVIAQMQNLRNQLFGHIIYAQQFLSILACIACIIGAVYTKKKLIQKLK